MFDKKSVGKRIKEIRLKNGKTQSEFGDLFSASKGNVATWEKGVSLPNAKRLKEIAKLGDITTDQLLYGYNKDVYMEIYNDLLEKHQVDTRVGKALRYPEKTVITELLKSAIEYTSEVPLLKKDINSAEDILKNGFYFFIEKTFLDYYIENHKSNNNILALAENSITNILSNIIEYQFYSFNLQISKLFNDATVVFSEYEKSVSLELLKEVENLSNDFLKELDKLKSKYPDNTPQRMMNAQLFREDPIRRPASYIFEIPDIKNNEEKQNYIFQNIDTIINGLIKDNPQIIKLINTDYIRKRDSNES
ncbi:helix-turn-helix transcriptional regulator [Staphylococcus capitis]|uniref:helix-turn-helix domain-containing protein n=1 Tax=Staphylococcus capitis TaxID=29388 RepID=UPI002F2688B9